MTGNEYQVLAARTINNDLSEGQKTFHALHGMVAEVGEIHSIYQKVFRGHEFDEDEHRQAESQISRRIQ